MPLIFRRSASALAALFATLVIVGLRIVAAGSPNSPASHALRPLRAPVPPLAPAAPGDENWDNRFGADVFGVPGANAGISDIWVDGSDLYVVGDFSMIDGVPVNHIARWDGSTWSALGLGIDDYTYPAWVVAVTGYQGDIVVAGNFQSAGGTPVNSLARWDGTAWSPVGDDPVFKSIYNTMVIRDIEALGDDLYATGNFDSVGGVYSRPVAKFDGTSWWPLTVTGPDGCTPGGGRALGAWQGDMYVGGCFASLDGVPVNFIARWDGAQWQTLGSGVSPPIVDVITPHNGELYVGGDFDTAGNTDARGLAMWNGNQWYKLTSAPPNGDFGNNVFALTFFQDDLYIGGPFDGTISVPIQHLGGIGRLETFQTWDNMDGGVNGLVSGLAVFDNELIIVGSFTTAGGLDAFNITRWDGEAWKTESVNDRVLALASLGDEVYLGGEFTKAGGTPASHMAKWDGTSWSALGSGLNGAARSMAVIGTELYVAGDFTEAGGSPANYVARWDGSTWSSLGPGMNTPVYALTTDGVDLYAGGTFVLAGGGIASHVARWDGSTWTAMAGGTDGVVYALAAADGQVYAGGDFQKTGGLIVGNAIRWDGSAWNSMNYGFFDGAVRSLAFAGGELYAGGDFTKPIVGTTSRYVARWDGSNWLPLPNDLSNGVDGPVLGMTEWAGGLLLAGSFETAGTVTLNHLARYDGGVWSAFGSGLDDDADALVVSGSSVYVGGLFRNAGGKDSYKFAHWSDPVTGIGPPQLSGSFLGQNHPNPFNPSTTIEFSVPAQARATLKIYDVAGRLVRTLVDEVKAPGRRYSVVWDGRDRSGREVSSGLYFYRLETGDWEETRKLVIIR